VEFRAAPLAIPPPSQQEGYEIDGKRGGMAEIADKFVEIEIRLPDEHATRSLGAALARAAVPGSVILLSGRLGAGKTTFAQGFAAGLGSTAAASPSFVLAHHYPGGRLPLWHLDLYRMDDAAAIDDLDLDQYVPVDGVALVEWPERAPGAWPADRIEIDIVVDGPGRRAKIRGLGRCAAPVRAAGVTMAG
jgi:tRNA threonylcarbamoyl adenosine modification protein YjeE